MQRFTDLGVGVRFTDLDRQLLDHNTMTQVCLNQPRCTGLTLWRYTDKPSWATDYPTSPATAPQHRWPRTTGVNRPGPGSPTHSSSHPHPSGTSPLQPHPATMEADVDDTATDNTELCAVEQSSACFPTLVKMGHNRHES